MRETREQISRCRSRHVQVVSELTNSRVAMNGSMPKTYRVGAVNLMGAKQYTHTYIYIHIYIYSIRIHTHIHIYIYIHTHLCYSYLGRVMATQDLFRNWGIAFAGNMLGCLLISLLANYTGVLAGGASDMIIATVMKKLGFWAFIQFITTNFCLPITLPTCLHGYMPMCLQILNIYSTYTYVM